MTQSPNDSGIFREPSSKGRWVFKNAWVSAGPRSCLGGCWPVGWDNTTLCAHGGLCLWSSLSRQGLRLKLRRDEQSARHSRLLTHPQTSATGKSGRHSAHLSHIQGGPPSAWWRGQCSFSPRTGKGPKQPHVQKKPWQKANDRSCGLIQDHGLGLSPSLFNIHCPICKMGTVGAASLDWRTYSEDSAVSGTCL